MFLWIILPFSRHEATLNIYLKVLMFVFHNWCHKFHWICFKSTSNLHLFQSDSIFSGSLEVWIMCGLFAHTFIYYGGYVKSKNMNKQKKFQNNSQKNLLSWKLYFSHMNSTHSIQSWNHGMEWNRWDICNEFHAAIVYILNNTYMWMLYFNRKKCIQCIQM